MIITCENCHVSYLFDESLLKDHKLRVRCARCKHIFNIYSTDTEREEAETSLQHPQQMKESDFDQMIRQSGLSVRATNVLLSNVSSLEEFLELTFGRVMSFQNCGRKTAREIMDFIGSKTTGSNANLSIISTPEKVESEEEKIKRLMAQPPTEDTVRMLPLFCSAPIRFMSLNDFHEGFKANIKLSSLEFSARTSKVLNDKGVLSVGELFLLTDNKLLQWKNFGRKSLREIRQAIRALLLETGADKTIDIDITSYENMIGDFIEKCIKKQRDREILILRFINEGDKLNTYDDIGKKYDITRERVRQVINKGIKKLSHPINRKIFTVCWNSIRDGILEGGGIIDIKSLCKMVQKHFEWENPVNPLSLLQILNINPRFHIDDDNNLVSIESDCLDCPESKTSFEKLTQSGFSEMNVWVFSKKLAETCQNSCRYLKEPVSCFHLAYIERLIEQKKNTCIIKDDIIYPYEIWKLKHGGSISEVAYTLLEMHGKPMHFEEIAELVRGNSIKFNEISDRYIHGVMIENENVRLIDNGTFALHDWDMTGYRRIETTLDSYIAQYELPVKKDKIINAFEGEYSTFRIERSLDHYVRFTKIEPDYYDLTQRWKNRSYNVFINMLGEPIKSLAIFVTNHNNCSYKPVLGMVFIQNMDNDGHVHLSVLEDFFYNFYKKRQNQGLLIESKNVVASKILEIKRDEFIRRTIRNKPLESFSNSTFFEYHDKRLKLKSAIGNALLSDLKTFKILRFCFQKSIDEYFESVIDAEGNGKNILHENKIANDSVSLAEDDFQNSNIKYKTRSRAKIRI